MGRECHAIQASRTARRTVWALDAACVNCERSLAAQAASSGDKRCSSRRGRSSMNCAMDCSDSWGGHDTCSGNGGCGEDDICCECKGISKAALSRRYCLLFKVPWFNRCRSRACSRGVVEVAELLARNIPSRPTTQHATKRHLKGVQNRQVWAIRNMVFSSECWHWAISRTSSSLSSKNGSKTSSVQNRYKHFKNKNVLNRTQNSTVAHTTPTIRPPISCTTSQQSCRIPKTV